MISVNTYLKLVGGSVKGRKGEFAVEFGGETSVFPAGRFGGNYLFFELEMQKHCPIVTPGGPVSGGVLTTNELLFQLREAHPDLGPADAIAKARETATTIETECKVAPDLATFMSRTGDFGAVNCVRPSEAAYLAVEYPAGRCAGGVFFLQGDAAARNDISELVEVICDVTPQWTQELQTPGPVSEEGVSQAVEDIVAEGLLADKNSNPAIIRRTEEILFKLGSHANRARAASCYPRREEMGVQDFLQEAVRNIKKVIGVDISLEEAAVLLGRYQGVFRYDVRRKTIHLHSKQKV